MGRHASGALVFLRQAWEYSCMFCLILKNGEGTCPCAYKFRNLMMGNQKLEDQIHFYKYLVCFIKFDDFYKS